MFRNSVLILVLLYFPLLAQAAEPTLALPDLKGNIVHLRDYRGKLVVVNYWATWCPPCREELPQLEAFYKAHRGTAVVLGVNYEDTDPGSLKSFVEQHRITYPILQADVDQPTPFGRIYGLPTSFVISPQGKLVQSHTGPVTLQYLDAVLAEYAKRNTMVMK